MELTRGDVEGARQVPSMLEVGRQAWARKQAERDLLQLQGRSREDAAALVQWAVSAQAVVELLVEMGAGRVRIESPELIPDRDQYRVRVAVQEDVPFVVDLRHGRMWVQRGDAGFLLPDGWSGWVFAGGDMGGGTAKWREEALADLWRILAEQGRRQAKVHADQVKA